LEYVAFLRGINVGGKFLIKMTDLTEKFQLLGMKDVRAYIQSGNILFNSAETDTNKLAEKIEKGLLKFYKDEIAVIIRTIPGLENMIKQNPFKKIKDNAEEKIYVTLLRSNPDKEFNLPLISPNKDVEVFYRLKSDLFCISRVYNGRYGFPNAFVEKTLNVKATTRNWTTINKVVSKKNS